MKFRSKEGQIKELWSDTVVKSKKIDIEKTTHISVCDHVCAPNIQRNVQYFENINFSAQLQT